MSRERASSNLSPPSDDDTHYDQHDDQHHAAPSGRPNYMTVGSGSISESGMRLASILDRDAAAQGASSLFDGETLVDGLHPAMGLDLPTPRDSPMRSANGSPLIDPERRTMASHIHQMLYNQNRAALARAITKAVDTLRMLQETNAVWPAHYPTVQQREDAPSPTGSRSEARPGLTSAHTAYDGSLQIADRPGPKRSETWTAESSAEAESSAAAAVRPTQEPRLVTPQLARDFSILKLDLKMGSLSQAELVHSLEKHSISALLDGQISKTIRHLQSIRERIEDTSSKVLVTGDLNAGKSTFCNALLRRKILPEDQQPCTSIFCEVLDSRENGGVEEVHAIPVGKAYDRRDERTYSVFELEALHKIVIDNDRWSQCKIYIKDIRTVDESLLNNGVVDIALIDAPGLNLDSVITTANFAKQEEIDVVVFVVSAANHFTQSAKEFIFNAAREKAYIFMVVNGFDNIKDKQRCEEMILKQVAHLSPATFKESSELVHFVSSNDIPTYGSKGSGSGGGPDGGDDGDDGDDDSKGGKGKGKDKENAQDFAELEASLRRFVLEKRARSKLAPAKTYLLNLSSDLHNLAAVNRSVAQGELDRVGQELAVIEPELEKMKAATSEAGENTDKTIESTVSGVYNYTRSTLKQTMNGIATFDFGIEYPGLLSAYSYAEELKYAMIDEITKSVEACEDHARQQSVVGVNAIKSLGILHLGNKFPDFSYKPEHMFRKKKHAVGRQIDIEVEFLDFFDIMSLWRRQEKVASTSMAVTVAGVVGTRLIGGTHWIDGAFGAVRIVGVGNMRRLVVPGIIAGGTCSSGIFLLRLTVDSVPGRRLRHHVDSLVAPAPPQHEAGGAARQPGLLASERAAHQQRGRTRAALPGRHGARRAEARLREARRAARGHGEAARRVRGGAQVLLEPRHRQRGHSQHRPAGGSGAGHARGATHVKWFSRRRAG
jgi:GTP-binding protein EngB required for normal cell division